MRSPGRVPPIFALLRARGDIGIAEMFRAFNMGIGLIVVSAAADAARIQYLLERSAEPDAVRIGEVVPGGRSVRYRNLS